MVEVLGKLLRLKSWCGRSCGEGKHKKTKPSLVVIELREPGESNLYCNRYTKDSLFLTKRESV